MTTKPDDDIAAFLADWTTAETGRDVETLKLLADSRVRVSVVASAMSSSEWGNDEYVQ